MVKKLLKLDSNVTCSNGKVYAKLNIVLWDDDSDYEKQLLSTVNGLSDPVLSILNRDTLTTITENIKIKEIALDVLIPRGDSYQQYRCQIKTLDKFVEPMLLKNNSLKYFYFWIYGLFIDGKYINSNYKISIDQKESEITWNVKIFHNEIIKNIMKVKLRKYDRVDLEYFLDSFDDLNLTESKKQEEKWKNKEIKYEEEMKKYENLFKEQKERVVKMQNLMKSHFLKTINSLLRRIEELENDDMGPSFDKKKRIKTGNSKRYVEIVESQNYVDHLSVLESSHKSFKEEDILNCKSKINDKTLQKDELDRKISAFNNNTERVLKEECEFNKSIYENQDSSDSSTVLGKPIDEIETQNYNVILDEETSEDEEENHETDGVEISIENVSRNEVKDLHFNTTNIQTASYSKRESISKRELTDTQQDRNNKVSDDSDGGNTEISNAGDKSDATEFSDLSNDEYCNSD